MSAAVAGRKFDAAIAMETLEHIPPAMLGSCLDELFRALRPEGILLVSVPVEIGPMFLAKWAAKQLVIGGGESYSWREVIHATLGRSDLINRYGHKEFDWRVLVRQIKVRSELIRVDGIPCAWLRGLGTQIGIVARKR